MPKTLPLALIVLLLACACASSPSTSSPDAPSVLQVDVQPPDASIYIDDQYQGQIDGWRDGRIPIEPGARRVELRADDYLPQRFDIDVEPDAWLTLRVRLEPTIDGSDPPSDITPDEGDSSP